MFIYLTSKCTTNYSNENMKFESIQEQLLLEIEPNHFTLKFCCDTLFGLCQFTSVVKW